MLASARAGGASHIVSVDDVVFVSPVVSIDVGDTVDWQWNVLAPHTGTSDDGTSSNSVVLQRADSYSPGPTFSFTFTQAGSFYYYCAVHSAPVQRVPGPAMSGVVTVGAPPTATSTTTATPSGDATSIPATQTAIPTQPVMPGVTVTPMPNTTATPGTVIAGAGASTATPTGMGAEAAVRRPETGGGARASPGRRRASVVLAAAGVVMASAGWLTSAGVALHARGRR